MNATELSQTPTVHITPADWSDHRVRDIVAAHHAFFTDLEVGTTFNKPPSLESYLATLQSPDCIVLIAWAPALNDVVGCVGLQTFPEGIVGHDGESISTAGEVRTMYTDMTARGRGVAGKLLKDVEKLARDRELTRLYIETGSLDGYAAARKLYFKAGFQECSVFGRYSKHSDILCMVKEL